MQTYMKLTLRSLIGQWCRESSSWHSCRYKTGERLFDSEALVYERKMYRLGQQSISKIAFDFFLSTVPRERFHFTRQYNKSWSCIGWFLIKYFILNCTKMPRNKKKNGKGE